MMSTLIPVLGVVVAVVAAVRSTWSPCGLSMLSTITPFGERSRGHRYAVTASWFVAGATLGGASLGAVGAGLAWAASAVGLDGHPTWVAVAVAVSAGLAAAVDAGVFGPLIPIWRRQVDDGWLGRYRSWVYGAGFGWQIGVGLATYIMTAAVFLVVAVAVVTADPLMAVGICTLFGLVRGVAVLLTARVQSPSGLRALHRRFEEWAPASRRAVIAVEVAVAIAVLAAKWPVGGGAVGLAVVGLAGAVAVAATGMGRYRSRASGGRRRLGAGAP
jgi:hypothetical protein